MKKRAERAVDEPRRLVDDELAHVAFAKIELDAGRRSAFAGHYKADAAKAAKPRVAIAHPSAPQKARLTRSATSVLVLNGGGRAGAAAAAAVHVRARGYMVASVGNATGPSPQTLVMYRPGFTAEGVRLAHDLHVRVVSPLDGMRPSQLLGAHLVLIVS